MSESSALTDLTRKLRDNKRQELEQIQAIEKEKLNGLAESLKRSLQTELSLIEDDMSQRLNKLREKMTEARQKIIEDEKATLKEIRTNRKAIESEAESLMQSLNKVKVRYWITPMIVALSMILGLVIGMWGLGVAIADRTQDLTTLNAEIDKAKESKKILEAFTPVSKIYKNGIEVKKGYIVKSWQGDNGLWFAEIEKGQ